MKPVTAVVALAVLSAGAGIGYYFGLYLPRERSAEKHLENSRSCAADASEYSKKFNELGGLVAVSSTHFSTDFNTCLLDFVHSQSESGSIAARAVIDVYQRK